MAIDQTPDPLERATSAIGSDDLPGWIELSETIMGRVRTLVTPAATLIAFARDGRAEHDALGSRVRISGRVLTPQLRAIIDGPNRATDALDIIVVGDRCSAIHVELVCSYGSDLNAEGQAVRRAVADLVRTVLGPDPQFNAETDIEIEIVDVVDGNPHTV